MIENCPTRIQEDCNRKENPVTLGPTTPFPKIKTVPSLPVITPDKRFPMAVTSKIESQQQNKFPRRQQTSAYKSEYNWYHKAQHRKGITRYEKE